MTRSPLTIVSGPAVPLLIPNVDTDVIIRVERMTSQDPATLAPWAFELLRYDRNGNPLSQFVINDPAYANAPILIAGENFGCGSSREPAVWALMGLGFRCVIAPSFGDIFRANCLTNGVLPVVLNSSEVDEIVRASRSWDHRVTVDLWAREVSVKSRRWPFQINNAHRRMLLNGHDEMDLALSSLRRVETWEKVDMSSRPWAWPAVDNS